MKKLTKDWARLAGAFVAIPAMFAAVAFADSSFEFGVLHSTWQTAVALFGFVSLGLYLLWQVDRRAHWRRIALMFAYAPVMFAFMAWLGLVVQFTFDGCMAQQAVVADLGMDGASAEGRR